MKPMKFRIKNPEHSEAIQRELFRLGYTQWDGSTNVTHTVLSHLLARQDGGCLFTHLHDTYDGWAAAETTLEELQVMGPARKAGYHVVETSDDPIRGHEPNLIVIDEIEPPELTKEQMDWLCDRKQAGMRPASETKSEPDIIAYPAPIHDLGVCSAVSDSVKWWNR